MAMTAESRKHARAPLLATAVLHKGTRPIGSFRVVNASAGGLLLAGEAPAGTDQVEVLLRLPADRFIRGQAAVVRTEVQNGRPAFALAFSGLRADQERLIQDAVLTALDEARTAAVLILEDDLDVTQALREAVARLGYRSFPVASFLELVHTLERPNSFCVAFVADALCRRAGAWANGSEVLEYLAAQHSEMRRVLIIDHSELAQLEGENGHPDSVHEILTKPWTESRLAHALGCSPTLKVNTLPDR
jgi:ActR/RegA family two-component response regulator